MGRPGSNAPHLFLLHCLGCRSWYRRQCHHLAVACCAPIVKNTHDDIGMLYVCPVFLILNPKQGRIPGTDRWKPIDENPEAMEDVPGALIIRLRENLDFGESYAIWYSS